MARRFVVTQAALALVLGGAVARLVAEREHVAAPALLLIVGAMVVGGVDPRRWWIGTLVGLVVSAVFAWTHLASSAPVIGVAEALLAPLLALAAAGLGGAMVRHLREE